MKKRILIMLMVVIALFAVTTSSFAASSLWSENGKSGAITTSVTDALKSDDSFSDLKDMTNRYELVNSDESNITGSIGYSITGMFYGGASALGNACIGIVHFANDFNIFKSIGTDDQAGLGAVFKSFSNYFNGSNFIGKNSILALALMFSAFIGMYFFFRGEMSKGVGRFLSIILICVIGFTLYGNLMGEGGILDSTNSVMTSVRQTSQEAITGSSSIESAVADNLIVRPYNLLQYGQIDPLDKDKGIMRDIPSTYNYFITQHEDDIIWFGKGVGTKASTVYTWTDAIKDEMRTLVAEDLAGEGDGAEPDEILDLDKASHAENKTPYKITVGDKNYYLDDCFANTGGRWFPAAGQAIFLSIIALALTIVFLGLAGFMIIGQFLVILVLLISVPILLFALFKGLEPLRNAGVLILFGFMLNVIGGIFAAVFVKMLDLFTIFSGGNMLITFFLIILTGVLIKVFAKQIFGIFGLNPNMLNGMSKEGKRKRQQARHFKNQLKKEARDKKAEAKREKTEKFGGVKDRFGYATDQFQTTKKAKNKISDAGKDAKFMAQYLPVVRQADMIKDKYGTHKDKQKAWKDAKNDLVKKESAIKEQARTDKHEELKEEQKNNIKARRNIAKDDTNSSLVKETNATKDKPQKVNDGTKASTKVATKNNSGLSQRTSVTKGNNAETTPREKVKEQSSKENLKAQTNAAKVNAGNKTTNVSGGTETVNVNKKLNKNEVVDKKASNVLNESKTNTKNKAVNDVVNNTKIKKQNGKTVNSNIQSVEEKTIKKVNKKVENKTSNYLPKNLNKGSKKRTSKIKK